MKLPAADRLFERAARCIVAPSVISRYSTPFQALSAPAITPELDDDLPDAICLQGPFEGLPDLRQALIVIGVGSIEEWLHDGTPHVRSIAIKGDGVEKRKAWLDRQARNVWPELMSIKEFDA